LASEALRIPARPTRYYGDSHLLHGSGFALRGPPAGLLGPTAPAIPPACTIVGFLLRDSHDRAFAYNVADSRRKLSPQRHLSSCRRAARVPLATVRENLDVASAPAQTEGSRVSADRVFALFPL